jgi:hypothetical protein
MKTRKVTKNINLLSELSVTVEHNGYQGGDAGHGGYSEITFVNPGGTAFEVKCEHSDSVFSEPFEINGNEINVPEPAKVTLRFTGDCERDTLIEGLKFIISELEANPNVNENFESVVEHKWVI